MANKILLISLLCSLILWIDSCSTSSRHLSASEYTKWIADPKNNLRKIKDLNGVSYTIQYKPVEWIVLNERGSKQITNQSFHSALAEYKGLIYFDLIIEPLTGGLSILNYNSNSIAEYNRRLDYYSFKMKEDLSVIIGQKTFPAVLYNFINSHELSKRSVCLCAFDIGTSSTTEGVTLRYDATAMGYGIIKIQIKGSDIEAIPQLNLQ